ncbi:hypothetical protein A2V47_02715 [Candidatus Atribacteria bacterium RBG_19FT_COMBO_35_14]|uniref:DUF2914 domain-containing protein n=1 Tax=Candidatus Sediminicultor quintus TaxID=1797291 RepID=A0A1F5ADC3_9BACT|nr:MAG: hypothetical protein A2V47_02715 [Candidatus Atribacteria bacterium RBG_19FT_COMBO_35_14]
MSIIKKRNIFRMELWLFALIFLMIFSGVSMAQEAAKDSEYLQKIALCKDILDKNPLQGVNFFFPQDEKVVTWLRFSYDSAEKFLLKWEWITPQGKLYHQGEVEMEAGSYTNYRTWYWIKIKGNYASQLPGEWKVRVHINDIFLTERNFFIVGPF